MVSVSHSIWRIGLAVGVLVVLSASGSAQAQTLSGAIGAAWVWQDVDGSEQSFRSQMNLEEGFLLEDLELNLDNDTRSLMKIEAWGFGGAEPHQRATAEFEPVEGFDLRLLYDRRESFFGLAESDLSLRSDEWNITRFEAGVWWDGWSAARVGVTFRAVEREGYLTRPFYGLNEKYMSRVEIDERMTEGVFTLETRALPVHLLFEQSVAEFRRNNRTSPAGQSVIEGEDPDLLNDMATDIREDTRVPTTRLSATYGGDAVEVGATILWSDADLETSGAGWETYDIGGGAIGSLTFLDAVIGSASRDTLAANLHLGLRLGGGWTARVRGLHRDVATDGSVLGERLVRSTNPNGGGIDLTAPIDDGSRYENADTEGSLELEWSNGVWTFWGGGLLGRRNVSWIASDRGAEVATTRDTSGARVGLALTPVRHRLRASLEYETGNFERYVFRTDPDTVDRLSFRLRTDLGRGWSATATARLEEKENPSEIVGLDHDSTGGGIGCVWASVDGDSSAGAHLDLIDLATDTGLLLPGDVSGISQYETRVTTVSVFGSHQMRRLRLEGNLTWLEDRGATWPLDAWTASARVTFLVPSGPELGVFGELWSYDEVRAARDDFDVTRFGVSVYWRFE